MLLAALGLLLTAMPLGDSVLADLNSPIYAVRETARDTLRASYTPTDRKKWQPLIDELNKEVGHSPGDVSLDCAKYGVPFFDDPGHLPPSFLFRGRLDPCWMLECTIHDDQLQDARLIVRPQILRIDPPGDFTGLWRTYRQDGELASQVYYSKGTRIGPLVDSPIYHATKMPPMPDLGGSIIEYDPGQ